MEWIKAKYDRVLLGFCGLVALIIGALLLMKAVGWKKQFSAAPDAAGNRSDFGTSDAGKKLESALTLLKGVAKVDARVDADDIPIQLFNSAPVMKVAGDPEPIAILKKGSKQIRPPIENRWLYENNLDLRQVNIGEVDTDLDHFSNKEEANAKPQTNPRDAASHPPVSAKIVYKEVVQESLSLAFNAFTSVTEVTFRVTGATPDIKYSTKVLAPGAKIQASKGGEDRFELKKVDGSIPGKEVAELLDLKTKETFKLTYKEEKQFPTNHAKLVCTLGKEEEKVVSKGEEFSFEADADQKYTVKDVTPDAVILEYTPKGAAKAETLTIKILPPP